LKNIWINDNGVIKILFQVEQNVQRYWVIIPHASATLTKYCYKSWNLHSSILYC